MPTHTISLKELVHLVLILLGIFFFEYNGTLGSKNNALQYAGVIDLSVLLIEIIVQCENLMLFCECSFNCFLLS